MTIIETAKLNGSTHRPISLTILRPASMNHKNQRLDDLLAVNLGAMLRKTITLHKRGPSMERFTRFLSPLRQA